MKIVYLDNNATTQIDPCVLEVMIPYFTNNYGNPSSNSHILGWMAESAVSKASLQISQLINSDPSEIFFTSGATESNNMVLKGLGLGHDDHVVVSNIEHKCVLNAANYIHSNCGVDLSVVQCNHKGLITSDVFEESIRPNTKLASIMLGNNEVHSVNDISKIADICKKKGILLHVDATQAVGKIEVNVKKMGVDFLSFSSHKFYGPKGIGALFIKGGLKRKRIAPLFHGGSQQGGIRSGTLPVPLIVGLGKASEIANESIEKGKHHLLKMMAENFYHFIRDEINDITLNGPDFSERLPGGLSISFPHIDIGKVQFECPDICFSRGSACSSGELDYSYVLKALGVSAQTAAGTARFCVGKFNTSDELQYSAESIVAAIKKLYKK